MYTLTRQETSEILGISTRSVDRYIRSGKLRSQKKGKIVYVNNNDVNNMKNGGKQEIIIPSNTHKEEKKESDKLTLKEDTSQLSFIYNDLREQIIEKDNKIAELSLQLGKVSEIAKNSISMIEFNKSQLLLEQSKENLEEKVNELKKINNENKAKLKSERRTNGVLLLIAFILFIGIIVLWYQKV